jgi:hypothetical protein
MDGTEKGGWREGKEGECPCLGSCCGATGRVVDKEIMTQGHNENSGCRQSSRFIQRRSNKQNQSRIMQTTFTTPGVLRVHIDWRLVIYLYTHVY